MTNVVTILIAIVTLVLLVLVTYLYFRDKTLEEIRADVYKLFLQAEHKYTKTGAGKQKLQWVVRQAHDLLPNWLRFFITEEILTMIIDSWFGAVKDLLDDGKLNDSKGETDE